MSEWPTPEEPVGFLNYEECERVISGQCVRSSMSFDDLAEGWELWNEEKHKLVFTYRPDVFNSSDFPAPCLPTIHVTKGRRSRRPGRNTPDPDDSWYVQLYLEPDVTDEKRSCESRERARAIALEVADQFVAGAIDYRELYQVPRPAYFDRLDELLEAEQPE